MSEKGLKNQVFLLKPRLKRSKKKYRNRILYLEPVVESKIQPQVHSLELLKCETPRALERRLNKKYQSERMG